jgi:(2Fe-2S) ferredoxin
VLICTNDRQGARKACADGAALQLREQLKELVRQAALHDRVRVSATGCMGLCAEGPNVLIYPQGLWFSGVTPGDAPQLLATLEALVAGREPPL